MRFHRRAPFLLLLRARSRLLLSRPPALTLHASGEIKTLQPSTLRWTEKQPRNHRDSADECQAASPRGVPLSVEAKGAGWTTVFALNTPEFVRSLVIFYSRSFKNKFGPNSVWSWTLFRWHPAWCAGAFEELVIYWRPKTMDLFLNLTVELW